MANGENKGLSILYRTEDWLAVWLGFLIIALVLAGLTVKPPKFKWTTEGEFAGLVKENTPVVEALAKLSEQKGEAGAATALGALRQAMAKGERKAVGDAAKKVDEALKPVKDKDFKKSVGEITKKLSSNSGALLEKIFAAENLLWSLYLLIGFGALALVGLVLLGQSAGQFIVGFPVVFIIAWVSQFIAGNFSINELGLEYVLWCLALGLVVSNVVGLPEWLKPAVQTEFYIKTGLVILGTGILFGEIVQAGIYGIVQAALVIAVIWYFCYWLSHKKMGIDQDFSALLSSAVSICGVSAAIATAGAIKADPKKMSYVTSITLICAIPMLVLQPAIAKWVGMPDVVAGAWLGGTLDTSGSVVAAGALISETAMKTGVIVKMSQNVFIGFAAFFLAIWWTYKECRDLPESERPGAIEIWNRFPKFVLGFMISSLVFSFLLSPDTIKVVKGPLGGLRTWWFALAFTCIGLETHFGDLAKMGGGRPAVAFVIAQSVNIIWTLILAYLIFGGVLFPPPKM
ncbi:MAG: putative sulfate exporter family transporter [Desulfarculus sp.]|nr:putative sulfate exporter family transporter [Desulfarculus sp.]